MDLPLNNFTLDNEKKINFAIDLLKKEEKPFILVYSSVGSDLLSIYDPKGKLKKFLEENSYEKITYGMYSESPAFLYYLKSLK
jgi:hypothetical protein